MSTNIYYLANFRSLFRQEYVQLQQSSPILPLEILQYTDREVDSFRIVLTSDKQCFLGLREVYWPDVPEEKIERWYGSFIHLVRRYDDIINNYVRLNLPNRNAHCSAVDAPKATASTSRRAGTPNSPQIDVISSEESETEIQSDDDLETRERNCILQ